MKAICVGGIAFGLACLAPRLIAQNQQTPSPPAFEVASVKPNPLRTGMRGYALPSDRLEMANASLRELVMVAYGTPGALLNDTQIAGGPSWLDTDRFDVRGKVGDAGPNTPAEKLAMLRTLLTNRFQLTTHTESRDQPIYALVLAKKNGALGPQLHRSQVDCEPVDASQPGRRERCELFSPPGKLIVRGQPMSAVAYLLTGLLDRVVQDRTGLTGGFDADAQFNSDGLPGSAPADPGTPTNDLAALMDALQQQLGLKLQAARGPVRVLVVDRAEHPSED